MSEIQVLDTEAMERIVASVMPKTASDTDRLALMHMMRSSGLDPLRREVYPISYGGRLSIVVGVDGWRRLAHATRRYASGEASYTYDAEGKLHSCTFTVLTTDGGRFSFTCWLDEFRQNTPTWHRSPHHMLRVKAEVHCLKAAFGLAGPTEYDAETEVTVAAPAVVRPQDERIAELDRLLAAPSTEAATVQVEPARVDPPAPADLDGMTDEQISEEIGRLAEVSGVAWTAAAARAAARRGAKTDREYRIALVSQYQRAKARYEQQKDEGA